MTKVYIVVTKISSEDFLGSLYHHDGHPGGSHMSSSLDWLKRDLTSNFGRDKEMSEKYPDGFEVVLVTEKGSEYDELVALWDTYFPNWRSGDVADEE